MLLRQTKVRGLGFGIGLCAALSVASLACGGKSDEAPNGSPGVGGEGGGPSSGGSGGRAIGPAASGGSAANDGSNDAGRDGDDTGGSAATGASGSTSVGSGGTSGSLPAGVCANGLDDDGDGLVDGFDPECIGPADNDEGSFATGIPGDNRDPKWQDCFFDGNSGAGDDGCRYATSCLYGETAQDHASCTVTEACLDYCGARTPNGCDCFGCCSIGLGDGDSVDVYTTSTCSLDNLDDEVACPRCTKSTACANDCGECELCPGKTVDDLPESCGSVTPPVDPPDGGSAGAPSDGGGDPPVTPPPTYTCEGEQMVCSAELPCESGFYCSFGCCLPALVR